MNISQTSGRRWRQAGLLAVWFLVIFVSASAWAQVDYYWVGAPGLPQDWGTATNWNPNTAVPGAGDTAYLEPNDASNRIAAFRNIHPPGTALNTISVNALGTGNMTLEVGVAAPAGDLRAGTMYLGTTGRGFLNQTNGAVNITDHLYLGNQTGSTGSYTMAGGALTANNLVVGEVGTGSFSQSGNTLVTVTNDLGLGTNVGGNGTYTLQGGTLNTNFTFVGHSGIGAFGHSGGNHTVDNELILGYVAGSNGTYNLSGTGILNTSYTIVGNQGAGTFTQSGGSHTIANNLVLGQSGGGSGTYNLTGGALIANFAVIGESGAGTFTQSQTTPTPTTVTLTDMGVGRSAGSSGIYNLNGGTLTLTGNLYVGVLGTGTFNQASGARTVGGDIVLGEGTTGIGTYNLQVGTLAANNLNVGALGIGNFNQSAGTTLTLASMFVNSRAGTSVFTQAGGTTTTVTGHLGVGRDLDPQSQGKAQYNLQGGTLNTGDLFVGYEGTGTFNQTGGDHAVNGDIWIGGEPTGIGTYILQNNTLTSNRTFVGFLGTGTFKQSGGTHTIANDLVVGSATGRVGTYTQTGGTNTVTGSLFLGNSPGSTGIYTLSGAAELSANYLGIGFNGGSRHLHPGRRHQYGGHLPHPGC